MSTTLTNGLKLPDKGSVDWYADMQSNYAILDGAVGTVAEYTSQIAGKAPAVHTHTKSDVTDLLNSNFIPSANNSYDLGSSSYQWNNLYAKNYFYNGTAWGLDKYNQWTGVNDFNDLIGLNNAELWFKQPNIEDITINPSVATAKSILQVWNKGTTQYFGGILDGLDTSGTHVFEIVNFGYPLNSTNAYQHRFRFASKRDGTASFYPTYPNVELGTSTNKWKTLNGINPGALSLPNGVNNDTSWIGDLTILDGSNYNEKTFLNDGWVSINIPGTAGNFILINNGQGQIVSNVGTGVHLNCAITFPVRANTRVYILINIQTGEQIKHAIWTGCAGNV